MKPQQFTIPQQFMVSEIKIDTKAQLDWKYMRLLIDAFVPYQEAMLAYLDELMAKHDPQLVERQLKEVERQSKKKSKEWEQTLNQLGQTDPFEEEKIIGRLEAIGDEKNALHQTFKELIEKLDIETRSQTILKHKRENMLKLLQRRQEMREEGTWEKIEGKNKRHNVFSFLGAE